MINIKNIVDNEFFKWCFLKYLHPVDHHPARIRKFDNKVAKEIYFRDIKFSVRIRDINKILKKKSIAISVFGYEKTKKIFTLCIKKCCEKKHVDLFLMQKEGKSTMLLSNILKRLCMIIHYTVEENIIAIMVYKL